MTNTPTGYIVFAEPNREEFIMNECCCASGKHKDRTEEEVRRLTNRLSRIEGQIR